jgi:hypothetical protein
MGTRARRRVNRMLETADTAKGTLHTTAPAPDPARLDPSRGSVEHGRGRREVR